LIAEFDAVCEWETGNPENPKSVNTHKKTKVVDASVISEVAYDPRVRNQITGFNLLKFGSLSESGDAIPTVGSVCKVILTSRQWNP
jgi:hypothetical protein